MANFTTKSFHHMPNLRKLTELTNFTTKSVHHMPNLRKLTEFAANFTYSMQDDQRSKTRKKDTKHEHINKASLTLFSPAILHEHIHKDYSTLTWKTSVRSSSLTLSRVTQSTPFFISALILSILYASAAGTSMRRLYFGTSESSPSPSQGCFSPSPLITRMFLSARTST
uniref:Uncharacterized protein n=1 Tax=Triticum urartu TaxID=4572 RepID=A0A8R7QWT1_TRIUA